MITFVNCPSPSGQYFSSLNGSFGKVFSMFLSPCRKIFKEKLHKNSNTFDVNSILLTILANINSPSSESITKSSGSSSTVSAIEKIFLEPTGSYNKKKQTVHDR